MSTRPCSVQGCKLSRNFLFSKTRCRVHELIAQGKLPPDTALPEPRLPMASPVCKLPVCSRPARARGLCNTHYQRKRLELKDWDKDVRRRRLDLKPIGLIKLSKKAADYYKWVADQRAMHPDDCAREVLEAYAANRMAEIIIDARTKSNPWDREGSTLDQDIEVPK